jgi:hypothetical protein
MDYASQERIESKAIPGVFLTFIKMVEGHRLELRRRAAAINAKIQPLARRMQITDKQAQEMEASNLDEAQRAKLTELRLAIDEMVEQANLIHQTELEPVWVQWGLLKIEGDLTINGAPPTAENIAFGPPELYREILATIMERLGLQADAIKNSSSPITSTAPADGATGDTTAESAKTQEIVSIPKETALATSQAA